MLYNDLTVFKDGVFFAFKSVFPRVNNFGTLTIVKNATMQAPDGEIIAVFTVPYSWVLNHEVVLLKNADSID